MLLRNLILMLAALVKWVWSEVQSVTASIFSVPSDSVKGQFSSIKILGNTEYDEVTGITKSTFSAGGELKSVGKNLWGSKKAAEDVVKAVNNPSYAYLTQKDGRNVLAWAGNSTYMNVTIFDKFKPNTQYTISVYARSENISTRGGYFIIEYSDGSITEFYTTDNTWQLIKTTSTNGKSIKRFYANYGSSTAITYYDYDTLQLEEGTVATPYEPYTESTAYTPAGEPLRSLPNGIKDEISVVGADKGTLVQRVGVDGEGNLYELPEPIVTQHEITILDQDGNPTNALQCGPGYTVYVEPADGNWEETTIPTIEYVYPKEG